MRNKLLLTLMLLISVVCLTVLPMATPVLAESPPGANTNNCQLSISVIPTVTYNDTYVDYYITVTNELTVSPLITADVQNVTVQFGPPTATGAAGPLQTIATIPYFAAGGTPVQYGPPGSPSPYIPIALLHQHIDLNPGVVTVYGNSHIDGDVLSSPPSSVDDTKDYPLSIIWPDTTLTISANPPGPVAPGTMVTLTVTETNTVTGPTDAVLHNGTDIGSPSVSVTSNPAGFSVLLNKASAYYVSGDAGYTGVLDGSDTGTPPGETWTWIIPNVVVNEGTTFTGIGDGLDFLGNHVTYPGHNNERATVSVGTTNPHTTASMSLSTSTVPPTGGDVTLDIYDLNDGSDPLTLPYMVLTVTPDPVAPASPVTLDKTHYYVAGDTNDDGVLDPGENWHWTITVTVAGATNFVVVGHGLDSLLNDITPDNGYYTERAEANVYVRTVPGFSGWSIGLMIAGFTLGILVLAGWFTRRRLQHQL